MFNVKTHLFSDVGEMCMDMLQMVRRRGYVGGQLLNPFQHSHQFLRTSTRSRKPNKLDEGYENRVPKYGIVLLSSMLLVHQLDSSYLEGSFLAHVIQLP